MKQKLQRCLQHRKVDDKLFIVDYGGEGSAFIMSINDLACEPLFYKVFFSENHSAWAGADIDYYGGKLHVYGAENSSETSDSDAFVAVFDLNRNLEDYRIPGRNASYDVTPNTFPEKLTVENGEHVLALA